MTSSQIRRRLIALESRNQRQADLTTAIAMVPSRWTEDERAAAIARVTADLPQPLETMALECSEAEARIEWCGDLDELLERIGKAGRRVIDRA